MIHRRIHISLSSLAAHPITSVNDYVVGLQKRSLDVRFSSADYGLQELTSQLTTGFREYVAVVDDLTVLIHCGNDTRLCDVNLPWNDVRVNIHFSLEVLPEWAELLKKTKVLLSAMKQV
ncbi:hypothetical protein RAD16_04140 [Bradyrhizobium sp. 18BD]